jgi:hypothetical protein
MEEAMKNTIIKVLSVVMAIVTLMTTVLVVSASAADECKHENYEQFGDPVAATCTEWGFTLYQCSDCKKAYKTEFNTFEKPHNLTKGFEWIVKEEVAGTCIADAYKITACPVCEEENIVVTPDSKGDHAWSEWTVVEASCTANGNKTRTCETCAKVETVALSFEGHEWVADTANYVEPKCFNYVAAYGLTDAKLANGSMPYTCKNCDATRTVVIKPVDYHTYVDMEAEADTCEVIGHNKGSFCKWCKTGETASDVVTDVIKHVWTIDNTKEIKYPSCETTGYWTLKCANCNTSYVHTADATGHEWDKDNPTTEVEPTCTTWGYKLYGCTKCGLKFENESIAPLGHKWSEEGTKKDPTCTEPGRVEYTCTNKWHDKTGAEISCTATNNVEDKNAPALGHGELESVAEITGDCTTDTITAGKKCTVCGKYVEGGNVVKAPGHKYVNNVCTVAGKYDTECSVCGDVKAEGVDFNATGKESHALRLVTEDAATCTTPGKAYYDCKYCAKYATELLVQTIPALGHKAKETKVPATCTKDGYILVTCETCLEQLSYTVLTKDPNGHTFADGAEAIKATCTTPGFEHGICLNCGFTVSKNLPALGHDIEIIPAKAATCTDAGNKQGERCKREGCTYAVEATPIAALGHDDKTAASKLAGKAATCTTKGLTEGTKCLRCETITTKQVEIPAYDHYYNTVQYSEEVVTTKTCKGAGSIGFVAHECFYCDAAYIDTFEYIPEHTYPETWTKKEVTCETDGYEYRLCTACGLEQVKDGTVVKATGHKNAAGTVFEATCSYAEGFDNKCVNKNCDYATKVVPVKHNFVMEPVVVDPCQGHKYNLYICEDCGHQKVDSVVEMEPQHDEKVIKAPAEGEKATYAKALETVYECKRCGNIRTAYKTANGIATKTDIKNLTNPGFHFVEGTKSVQFVISIRGDKNGFHNFNAKFTYDKSALTFKSAKFVKEISGVELSGATYTPDAGVVNLTAFVSNDENGDITNAVLTGEWQEFIVLEFSVNSEVFKGKTGAKLAPTAGLASTVSGGDANTFFYDVNGTSVKLNLTGVTNLVTEIYRLGDANGDGVVSSADYAALQRLILTDGYFAEADLDGDGAVKAKDLSLLQKLIVGSYTIKQLADGR